MALGVAVVFAVDIANESAKRAFAISLDTVTGRTTHRIKGGTQGLDESIYTKLRTEMGVRASAPVVEGTVSVVSEPTDEEAYTETLQLLGVDLFAEPMFRDTSVAASNDSGVRSALALLQPGSVILASTAAQRLGVQVGGTVNLQGTSTESYPPLTLISTVDTNTQPGFESLAMVDIATAQQILNMQGRLSRIDLILPLSDAEEAARQDSIDQDIDRITPVIRRCTG